jgi:hypothetical protein
VLPTYQEADPIKKSKKLFPEENRNLLLKKDLPTFSRKKHHPFRGARRRKAIPASESAIPLARIGWMPPLNTMAAMQLNPMLSQSLRQAFRTKNVSNFTDLTVILLPSTRFSTDFRSTEVRLGSDGRKPDGYDQ